MKKIFVALVTSLFVSGCLQTEYQADGLTGGYSDEMTGPNTATVLFKGNAFTKATDVRKFALRRAAELTVKEGFDYFLLEASDNFTKTKKLASNIQCNTIGYSTSCYDYGGGTTSHPRTSIDIRMFKGKAPNQTGYYDARYLIAR